MRRWIVFLLTVFSLQLYAQQVELVDIFYDFNNNAALSHTDDYLVFYNTMIYSYDIVNRRLVLDKKLPPISDTAKVIIRISSDHRLLGVSYKGANYILIYELKHGLPLADSIAVNGYLETFDLGSKILVYGVSKDEDAAIQVYDLNRRKVLAGDVYFENNTTIKNIQIADNQTVLAVNTKSIKGNSLRLYFYGDGYFKKNLEIYPVPKIYQMQFLDTNGTKLIVGFKRKIALYNSDLNKIAEVKTGKRHYFIIQSDTLLSVKSEKQKKYQLNNGLNYIDKYRSRPNWLIDKNKQYSIYLLDQRILVFYSDNHAVNRLYAGSSVCDNSGDTAIAPVQIEGGLGHITFSLNDLHIYDTIIPGYHHYIQFLSNNVLLVEFNRRIGTTYKGHQNQTDFKDAILSSWHFTSDRTQLIISKSKKAYHLKQNKDKISLINTINLPVRAKYTLIRDTAFFFGSPKKGFYYYDLETSEIKPYLTLGEDYKNFVLVAPNYIALDSVLYYVKAGKLSAIKTFNDYILAMSPDEKILINYKYLNNGAIKFNIYSLPDYKVVGSFACDDYNFVMFMPDSKYFYFVGKTKKYGRKQYCIRIYKNKSN